MLSFLVTCYSLISAFYTAVSQVRVSNCLTAQLIKAVKSPLSVFCRETQNKLQRKKAPPRDPISPQSWSGEEVLCSPAILHLRASKRTGEERKADEFICNSLFDAPVLSVWLSLCPVAGISVSKQEQFECILIILVIIIIVILFIILLHYCNNNNSENVLFIFLNCVFPLPFHWKLSFPWGFLQSSWHFQAPPLSPFPGSVASAGFAWG